MKRFGSVARAGYRKAGAAVLVFCCAAGAAARVEEPAGGAGPQTYTGAAIVSPEDDAAVRSNAGSLAVRVRVDPELQEGHRLQLLLDGVAQGSASRKPEFRLENIDRGTHSLQLQIVGEEGGVLFTGPASTFHLLRHSRLHP